MRTVKRLPRIIRNSSLERIYTARKIPRFNTFKTMKTMLTAHCNGRVPPVLTQTPQEIFKDEAFQSTVLVEKGWLNSRYTTNYSFEQVLEGLIAYLFDTDCLIETDFPDSKFVFDKERTKDVTLNLKHQKKASNPEIPTQRRVMQLLDITLEIKEPGIAKPQANEKPRQKISTKLLQTIFKDILEEIIVSVPSAQKLLNLIIELPRIVKKNDAKALEELALEITIAIDSMQDEVNKKAIKQVDQLLTEYTASRPKEETNDQVEETQALLAQSRSDLNDTIQTATSQIVRMQEIAEELQSMSSTATDKMQHQVSAAKALLGGVNFDEEIDQLEEKIQPATKRLDELKSLQQAAEQELQEIEDAIYKIEYRANLVDDDSERIKLHVSLQKLQQMKMRLSEYIDQLLEEQSPLRNFIQQANNRKRALQICQQDDELEAVEINSKLPEPPAINLDELANYKVEEISSFDEDDDDYDATEDEDEDTETEEAENSHSPLSDTETEEAENSHSPLSDNESCEPTDLPDPRDWIDFDEEEFTQEEFELVTAAFAVAASDRRRSPAKIASALLHFKYITDSNERRAIFRVCGRFSSKNQPKDKALFQYCGSPGGMHIYKLLHPELITWVKEYFSSDDQEEFRGYF